MKIFAMVTYNFFPLRMIIEVLFLTESHILGKMGLVKCSFLGSLEGLFISTPRLLGKDKSDPSMAIQ